MDFGTFILLFVGIVAFGTLAVTGWYFITRGEIKTREDGSKVKTGKVFRDWYFFWMRTRAEKKRIFFNEANLVELYLKIRDQYQSRELYHSITVEGRSLNFKTPEKFREERKWMEKAFDIKFFDQGGGLYSVYKEYDDFIFPAYVRDPLAQCATCFASIYGSAFYWLLIALVKQNLFAWASVAWLAAVFFWITFCFSLAVLNTALAKRWN